MPTTEQFALLLKLLEKIADRQQPQYTITGAQDWPILVLLGGIIVGMVAFMWTDLRATIKDGKKEWKNDLVRHEDENTRQFDYVWDAIRDCQGDCCDRGGANVDRRRVKRPGRPPDGADDTGDGKA